MNTHTCHAINCTQAVPPRLFMCRRHWYMVPKPLRDALWAAYVPGQERRKDPTPEYLDAAMVCVAAVATAEAS